jgi:hypothetical protein
MHRKLPRFFDLWQNYPSYTIYPSAKLKAMVGGRVAAMSDPDSCGVRLSLSFIRSKHPLPKSYSGMYVVPGSKSGEYFLVRVRDWINYLTKEYSKPTSIEISSKKNGGFDRLPPGFKMRGVICFWWGGGGGSQGHVDIWNGHNRAGIADELIVAPGEKNWTGLSDSQVQDSHWASAKRVYLWEASDLPF